MPEKYKYKVGDGLNLDNYAWYFIKGLEHSKCGKKTYYVVLAFYAHELENFHEWILPSSSFENAKLMSNEEKAYWLLRFENGRNKNE